MFKKIIVLLFLVCFSLSSKAQDSGVKTFCAALTQIIKIYQDNLHLTNDHLADYLHSHDDDRWDNPDVPIMHTEGLIEYWEEVLDVFYLAKSIANTVGDGTGVLEGIEEVENNLDFLHAHDLISPEEYFYSLYYYERYIDYPMNRHFSMGCDRFDK